MKLHLTVNEGTLAGQTFDLENGFLTIGRGDTCSVRFDPLSERVASKQHAFIEAKPDGYYLTDNQSTNGTLLNGAPISSAKLSSGDRVQFGKNGVTANVAIDMDQQAEPMPAESFRQIQVQQFDQIASQQQPSMQASLANFGLSSMSAVKAEPDKTTRYVGIGVTIFAVIFMSLVVALIMFFSVGPLPAVIAAIVAFVPATFYILPLIWLDRYDPEPIWLFALAFLWGALVAIPIAFVINTAVDIIVSIGVSPDLGEVAGAVVSAPIVEEGCKGIGVVILLIFFRRYFDDVLDGIVFAGVIALGFATVENILYYGGQIGQFGMAALPQIFIVRGIMTPFAHVTFTSMTGIGCGISRESHNKVVRYVMPFIGYCGAVTLHCIFNSVATFLTVSGWYIGYFVLEVPFFLIFVGFAFYVMHRQGKILKEMLAIDIARGLIPQELGATVTSPFKSSAWLLGGLTNGKFRARSNYLRAAGKLGLSYWHIQRATAAQGQTGSFQQNPILREEVLKWRDQV